MRRQSVLAACVAATLVLAACGGDDDSAVGAAAATTAAATADGGTSPASDTIAAPDTTAAGSDTTSAGSDTTPPAGPGTTAPPPLTAPDYIGDDTTPPDATLPADLPAELAVGFAPVQIFGTPLPPFDGTEGDPAVGMPSPAIVGYDAEGNVIHFDPATDGPAMLVFVAHWCPHCNNEIPRIEKLRDEGKIPDDLKVIAVLTGSRPDAPNWPPTDWINDMGWTYPTIMEGVDLTTQNPYILSQAFGLTGFPFVVLVDRDGNVAERWSGERTDPDAMIAEVTSVLGL